MAIVSFSHLGEEPISGTSQLIVNGGTIREIIDELEKQKPGFRDLVLSNKSNDHFNIATRVYFNPKVEEDACEQEIFAIDEETTVLESPSDTTVINPDDRLLISLLNPYKFKAYLETALMDRDLKLPIPDKSARQSDQPAKAFLKNEPLEFISQKILAFTAGEATFEELTQESGKGPNLVIKSDTDVYGCFERRWSRILPERLTEAICSIWPGVKRSSQLRLFQEDALFFILSKMLNPKSFAQDHLLISAPTGGGKTEAFLFPLLAQLIFQKEAFAMQASLGDKPPEGIKAIVIYPTKALANDQTHRLMELLYHINRGMPENQMITVGILTGDTPKTDYQLKNEPLVQICPSCGHANLSFRQNGNGIFYIECQNPGCKGNIHKYCRLTASDILSSPPDILVSNPDTISVSLQSPNRRSLFGESLETVIFDEIHLYDGIFGCNVAHLLRRLESSIRKIPLYVGLSATIENATELAAFMFDAQPEEILYLKERPQRAYQYDDGSNRVRYHAIVRPAPYQGIIRSCLNTAMALSHALIDPANRKMLVFANKTADVDRLVTYLDEAETKYFRFYVKDILPKIANGTPLERAELEALSEVGGWYTYLQSTGNPFIGAVYPGWHRGALEKKQRLEAINRFMSLKPIRTGTNLEYPIDIMIATKTLELGIDIGTVSMVLNCSAPFSSNEYYQRVGRGGRRGNSMAMTLLNDSGAIDAYFGVKFEELINNPTFEAVPIIITNKIIARQHVVGRILDFVAEQLSDEKPFEIKVKHLRQLQLNAPGGRSPTTLESDPAGFGKVLFQKIFEEKKIPHKGVETTQIEKYLNWLNKEAEILGVADTDINQDKILNWLIEKCKSMAEHGDPGKPDLYWEGEKSLSGYFTTVDRDLLTPLRGDGENVGIYTKEQNQDRFVEEISRIRACRSHPPRAYKRQGLNSFQIQSPVMKEDDAAERELVDIFWEDNNILEYYAERLGKDFPQTLKDLRYFAGQVVVPEELQVNYAPYRFYCDNNSCLRTFTHHEVNENLICKCNRQLKQVTQFISCPQCGDLIEPPVPKVCINPACIQNKMKRDPDFLRKLRSHPTYENPARPLFRFQSLAKQHWRCADCKVVFNFYNYHQGMWEDSRLNEVKNTVLSGSAFSRMNLEDPLGIALKFLYFPEHYLRWNNYLEKGYRQAMFKHWSRAGGCDKATTMRVVNIPNVTATQHRYLRRLRDLDTPAKVNIGDLDVFELQVIDIAKEYTRAYDKGSHFRRRETSYVVKDIFPNRYWANLYETHAFGLKFGNLIDSFLNSSKVPKECKELCDLECPHMEKIDESVREIYLPKLTLNQWELDEGKPKKSDPRSMWCPEAGKDRCLPDCTPCNYYVSNQKRLRQAFLKYIILHTLKHSIVWALPKYVGINLIGLNGQIYPNQNNLREDSLKNDIVIIDSAENGSGAMLLIKKNWINIWEFAETALRLTYEGEGNLNLPYSCFRFNQDLCPKIAMDFTDYIDSENNQKEGRG